MNEFPNLHLDRQLTLRVVELDDAQLDSKMDQYGRFCQRKDLMVHHLTQGHWILDRLVFDAACRDGVYEQDYARLEEETCNGA